MKSTSLAPAKTSRPKVKTIFVKIMSTNNEISVRINNQNKIVQRKLQVKCTTSGERLYTQSGGVEFLKSNIAADEKIRFLFFPLPFTQLLVFCSHVLSRRISCFHATSFQHFVPAQTEKFYDSPQGHLWPPEHHMMTPTVKEAHLFCVPSAWNSSSLADWSVAGHVTEVPSITTESDC